MDLFRITDETLEKGPAKHNRDRKSLQGDVKIVKEWMKSQKHLPEVMDEVKIRNFLTLNKCSIERTKPKIDMYYTIRSLLPDVYKNANPATKIQKKVMKALSWTVMPKLTPDLYRVLLFKMDKPELVAKLNVDDMIPFIFNLWEIRLSEDYMVGDLVIVDVKGLAFSFLVKWTPPILMKVLAIYEKVYSTPLKGVYMINCPAYISHLLNIFKVIMKPKLFERIHVFSEGAEVLKEHFPPECLPKDYCGQEKSTKQLKEMLYEEYDNYQSRFDDLDTMKVDESLRPEKLENDVFLGFHGNFKRLNLD